MKLATALFSLLPALLPAAFDERISRVILDDPLPLTGKVRHSSTFCASRTFRKLPASWRRARSFR